MLSRFALPVIFGGVVLSFVAATVFVHWEMGSIDEAALQIADDSAPAIEHLASARADIRRLGQVLRHERERRDRGETFDINAIEDARQTTNRAIEGYLSRPILPGERKSWDGVHRAKEALDSAVTRYEREAKYGDGNDANETMQTAIVPAMADLGDSVTEALESSAARTRESALRIRHLRSESNHVAIGLDLVCTLIAIMGAVFVHRIARADRDLANGRRQLQEERASELEDFAGRVAHDILSPLGAIGFALDLVRRTDDEHQRERIVSRGTSAVGRIQRLVSGLLDFARAGGKPAVGAQADVERTIADLVAELELAAQEEHVELTTRQEVPLVAACNPGVLTSLVANLTRNAIKYLGDAPVRRIEIRALDVGPHIRVEVEDTGPGLAPDLEKHVFEPYVRSPTTDKPGFGLGLATVKRLAEAHGGKVGVTSTLGQGSTFWFEIPQVLAT